MHWIERIIERGGPVMLPLLILGALATFGSLVAFLVSVSLGKRGVSQVLAAVMLGTVAAILGLGWLGHHQGWQLVQQAVPHASQDQQLLLAMTGASEYGIPPAAALAGTLLPLGFGLATFVLGLMQAPSESAGHRSKLVVAMCLAAGVGLLLWSLVDYLRYDDVLMLITMTVW